MRTIIFIQKIRNYYSCTDASSCLARTNSTAEFLPLGDDREVEYFFASDASAIIEHTDRVIYLLVGIPLLVQN